MMQPELHAMHFNRFPSYKEYARHVHALNYLWWHDAEGNRLDRDKPEMVMLQVSELAEALEGDRKDLMDDHLPQFKMFAVELADTIIRTLDYAGASEMQLLHSKGTIPLVLQPKTVGGKLLNLTHYALGITYSEGVDSPGMASQYAHALITGCVTLAREFGFDNIWDIVLAKLIYNQHRADHKYEARAKANGKKY